MAPPARVGLVALVVWGCTPAPGQPTAVVPDGAGDAERGRALIVLTGCGACHHVPGTEGPRGIVGPSLDGFARRAFIAGVVPNRPDLLELWVRSAPTLAPNTAMPNLPLDPIEAKHVAAYLATLD